MTEKVPEHVVFFDGVCHICNSSVDTLLKLDRSGKLSYAPLQGELATSTFGKLQGDPDSMVFARNGKVYYGFEGVIQIGRVLYPILAPIVFLLMIPPLNWIGKAIYRLIATYRYRWFGKYDSCKIVNQKYKDRFYD